MSKTITGKQAYELLNNAEAVIIDNPDSALMYPSVDEDEDQYELHLSYTDEEGLTYEYDFYWLDTDDIEVKDNMILLSEDDGKEPIGIKLLQTQTL